MSINFNVYSIQEIDKLIAGGICTETDVIWFYNNLQWRDMYD